MYRWGFNLYENPALPGDYNGNGTVDAADYTVWRNSLGTTGLEPYELGDGDGDGEVTELDYEVWRSQYGQTIPTGAAAAAAAVPEPGGLALLLCFAATWLTMTSGTQRVRDWRRT